MVVELAEIAVAARCSLKEADLLLSVGGIVVVMVSAADTHGQVMPVRSIYDLVRISNTNMRVADRLDLSNVFCQVLQDGRAILCELSHSQILLDLAL